MWYTNDSFLRVKQYGGVLSVLHGVPWGWDPWVKMCEGGGVGRGSNLPQCCRWEILSTNLILMFFAEFFPSKRIRALHVSTMELFILFETSRRRDAIMINWIWVMGNSTSPIHTTIYCNYDIEESSVVGVSPLVMPLVTSSYLDHHLLHCAARGV
jgi:hypothetical protein